MIIFVVIRYPQIGTKLDIYENNNIQNLRFAQVVPMFPKPFSSTTSLININIIGLASILLGGCQTSPDRAPDVTRVASLAPDNWSQSQATDLSSSAAPSASSNPVSTIDDANVPHQWVNRLKDPALSDLVEEALRNNLDLKVAAARMESSRQLMRMARADLFPTLGLEAGASYSDVSGAGFSNLRSDDYSVSLGTSWEVDLWGRVRNESLSGTADYEAAGFDLMQARHSIVAAVSRNWYACIAAREQLELAKATVASYSSTADLIRNRFESGIDTALEYRLAVANAEAAKSALASRQESYKRSVRSLQILLGRYPDADLDHANQLPAVNAPVPADIPASVLERRPDVNAAEKRLASAAFSARATTRAKLPQIRITGAAGLQTEDFKHLLDGEYEFWSAGVTVSQSLFAGGKIDANEKRAQAMMQQYQLLYEQVALQAFFEVEQALDADRYFADLEQSSRAAAEQSVEAEKLAWDQYTSGLISIVTVLESQRFALNAKQSAIEARNARLQNRIQLFLALGGDV